MHSLVYAMLLGAWCLLHAVECGMSCAVWYVHCGLRPTEVISPMRTDVSSTSIVVSRVCGVAVGAFQCRALMILMFERSTAYSIPQSPDSDLRHRLLRGVSEPYLLFKPPSEKGVADKAFVPPKVSPLRPDISPSM